MFSRLAQMSVICRRNLMLSFRIRAQRISFSPNAAEEPYLPYADWGFIGSQLSHPYYISLYSLFKCRKPRWIRGFLHFMRKYMQSDKILFFQIDL